MSLISVSDIETYLQSSISDENPSTTTGLESFWTMLINAVDQQVKNICNRDLESTDYVEYYDGPGTYDLVLKQYPLNSVSSIVYSSVLYDYDSTEVDLEDVYIDYSQGLIYNPYGWVSGRHNIKVSYNAGYTTIPDDLKMTCIKMAVDLYNNVDKNVNLKSETLGDYSYTIASGYEVKNEYKLALSNYIKLDY